MDPKKTSLDDLRIQRSDKPESNMPIRSIAIGLVVVLLAALSIWWLTRPKTLEVRVSQARETRAANNHTVLNASGYVTARRAATVSSNVTGKVVDVLIEEGM